jgi:hypothetical protein
MPAHEGCRILDRIWVSLDYDWRLEVWGALDSAWLDLCEGTHPYTYPSATRENFEHLVRREARLLLGDFKAEPHRATGKDSRFDERKG